LFSTGGGHPIVRKAAVVDIITPDLTMGAQPAVAELLGITDQCLNAFPGRELRHYVIHITHTKSQFLHPPFHLFSHHLTL
jgi:eukaryotic translation initiation factor 2-alpha kinase 4